MTSSENWQPLPLPPPPPRLGDHLNFLLSHSTLNPFFLGSTISFTNSRRSSAPASICPEAGLTRWDKQQTAHPAAEPFHLWSLPYAAPLSPSWASFNVSLLFIISTPLTSRPIAMALTGSNFYSDGCQPLGTPFLPPFPFPFFLSPFSISISIYLSICHICCLSSIYQASTSHLFCHLSKLIFIINYLSGYSDESSSIWSCQLSVLWSERNAPPHTHLHHLHQRKDLLSSLILCCHLASTPLFLDNALSLGFWTAHCPAFL